MSAIDLKIAHRRTRIQNGSLRKQTRKNGDAVWEFRYRSKGESGNPMHQISLPVSKYPTESHARLALQETLLTLNGVRKFEEKHKITVGVLVDRFIKEERLQEIKDIPPGSTSDPELLSYSSASSYLSMLANHIRPRWENVALSDVRPMDIQHWLDKLILAGKSKNHIKGLFRLLFERAILWSWIENPSNPTDKVRVKGGSKRKKPIAIISGQDFLSLREKLQQPCRTMATVAMFTGLRISEILGLRWEDFDFERSVFRVQRGVVQGRIGKTKTEASAAELPLHKNLCEELLQWREAQPNKDGFVFISPATGRCYHSGELRKNHIKKASADLGLEGVGWHTFRHSYRSLLDANGASVGTQMSLMRHSNISTTMNVYGKTALVQKQQANDALIDSILPKTSFSRPEILSPEREEDVPLPNDERIAKFIEYLKSASSRGYQFNLTLFEFVEICSKPCHYCQREPTAKTGFWRHNGVDRVNNDIGYTTGNCVPCCSICNIGKCTRTYDEFMAYISHIKSLR